MRGPLPCCRYNATWPTTRATSRTPYNELKERFTVVVCTWRWQFAQELLNHTDLGKDFKPSLLMSKMISLLPPQAQNQHVVLHPAVWRDHLSSRYLTSHKETPVASDPILGSRSGMCIVAAV
jgi:hypothetical protein